MTQFDWDKFADVAYIVSSPPPGLTIEVAERLNDDGTRTCFPLRSRVVFLGAPAEREAI